ncbi:hypothetical protein G6514_003188 [Epicoccum nigrum]|nr:hypothetical protein G6514_003188 [Epicoccum nigrum]
MATIKATEENTVKATRTCYSRQDFVDEWAFPIHPLHDFELDGEAAHYTTGHPRQWGDETHWLNFRKAIRGEQPEGSENSYDSYHAAVSPDNKLLAITSTHERVVIYDVESQELRQVLDGAGDLIFAPLAKEARAKTPEGQIPAYVICCSSSDRGHRSGINNQLVFWELDEQGRLLDQEESIDASKFAQQAIDAILPDLMIKHEWTNDFVKTSSLHKEFTKALSDVAITHRRQHNTVFDDAHFGGFGSASFSSDGRIFLYHTQNQSTQSGMREPDRLPRVVVVDVLEGKELYRLSGHTDAIMWSAISPNNRHIASVAWDGALRMYSAESGILEWKTTGTGQAWTGAFSADSKHIVWSTGNGKSLAVHDVDGGRAVSTFLGSFSDWCRNVAWHPDGQQIALCAGKHAYIWRPIEGRISQHYQIEDNWNSRMASVENVDWLDDGRLLHLYFSEGTNLIYNTQNNTKELFMHPKGADSSWVDNGFHGNIRIAGIEDGYLSVDGDGMVRYWSTGPVTSGSWWDSAQKTKEVQVRSTTKKAQAPLTEKYVMITRPEGKGKSAQKTETNNASSTG